jgi:hypothetical protein
MVIEMEIEIRKEKQEKTDRVRVGKEASSDKIFFSFPS